MHGARTMARCAIGVAGQATTSKTVTVLGIAAIAHTAAMMALTVSVPMTFAMSSKTAKSIPLTPTSNVATVPLLTTTLMSKGR